MYTPEMIKATQDRLYNLYLRQGVKPSRALYLAQWYAENRQRHFEQGRVYAKMLGLTGVAWSPEKDETVADTLAVA